jgi:hypothetical protein
LASVDDWVRAASAVVVDDGDDDAPHPARTTSTMSTGRARTRPRVGSVV